MQIGSQVLKFHGSSGYVACLDGHGLAHNPQVWGSSPHPGTERKSLGVDDLYTHSQ